ncbi:hypothetical protein [Chitinophaga rhizophila]|uniref:Uncharacterized protein n=1 Tax=Chitinophaga rhizophila TaxID=2866212 RepID=A0ABS7GIG0_9BACT|nr:hypothetical protein [Chitinophaga rhizophila]MBW8686263.1 hypothetical protein [Chitinophaga rhizophila]
MRSFIAFLACTGFIVWAHSCEKRIVGVKIYAQEPGPDEDENSHFSSNTYTDNHRLLLANVHEPVALDALFVDIQYGITPELDWE